ncbi:MAG TPA: PIN domain nuclease [Parvularcula sp.]|nr:PIN domain nuclease [Parvularcula sp.]
MKLLLDARAVYWFVTGQERLSPRAKKAIADPDNGALVSAASAYEIALKARRGRLDASVVAEFGAMLRAARLAVLPVSVEHALAAGRLPEPHRDPWDRTIMAQALSERATVVTLDAVFGDYGAPALW